MGRQNYGAQDAAGGSIIAPGSFPLQVDSGLRFLRQANGSPRRLKIDASWLQSVHATTEDQTAYLDAIKRLEFNGFVLMNIVHAGGGAWTDINEPNNIYNVPPFLTPNDFSTPNDVYFDLNASLVERAWRRDLTCVFFHSYLGYHGGAQGWQTVIDAQSPSTLIGWGKYLRRKFPYPNVLWGNGGDNALSGASLTNYQYILQGMNESPAVCAALAEWQDPDQLTTDQAGFTYGPSPALFDMSINWFYGDGPAFNTLTYPTADRAWALASPLPAAMGEPPYFQTFATREQCRRAQFWAFAAGAIAGSNYGEANRWDWTPALWIPTLTSPSTLDQMWRHRLLDSLEWWLMRPSGTGATYCGTLLITSANVADTTWIQACQSSSNNQLLAYVPPTGTGGTTFTADFSGLAGSVTCIWYNPTSGGTVPIGSRTATAGQSFTTPGDNGTGTNDWVLVATR